MLYISNSRLAPPSSYTMDITPSPAQYSESQLSWLQSKKLCSECQSIFKHWKFRDHWNLNLPDHRHHFLSALYESARQGCPICEIFLTGFWPQIVDEARLEDYRERGLVRISPGKLRNGMDMMTFTKGTDYTMRVQFRNSAPDRQSSYRFLTTKINSSRAGEF